LLVEYTHGEDNNDTRIASIENTSSNRIGLLGSNIGFNSGPYAEVHSGGNLQAQLLDRLPVLRSRRVVALSYKENDFRFCDSGRSVQSDLLGSVPTSLTNLYIGSYGLNGFALNGYVGKLLYFPKTFTDNELKMITTT